MAKSRRPPLTVISIAIVGIALLLFFGLYRPHAYQGSPAAPYNNGTVYTTARTAVSLQQELNNSALYGFNLSQSMFYASSSSQCALVLINGCNNNVPSQFVCINSNYNGAVQSQYQRVYSAPTVCPQYSVAGKLGCGLSQNYCVVMSSGAYR